MQIQFLFLIFQIPIQKRRHPNIDLTPKMDLDPYPASTSFQQPKWAQQLIEVAGDDAGDPHDKKKTRSQYQKESVALSHIDPLPLERCFMMLVSDPQSFKEACHDPRWQAAMHLSNF